MKKFFLFAVLIPFSAFAQNQLTPELLWKFGRVGDIAISPDNQQFLYTVTYYNLEKNKGNKDIYLRPIDDGRPNKLTNTETINESAVTWFPDGSRIGFISTENEGAQLWEMTADGSSKVQVTFVKEGIHNYKYAPTKDLLVFSSDVKIDSTIQDRYPDLPKANAWLIDDLMYRHWDSWHDFKYSHIFISSYGDGSLIGEPMDIMPGEPYDAGSYDISPEGNLIAYDCKKKKGKEYAISTNTDIYLYDVSSGTTLNVSEGMMGYDRNPVFSPDGKKLAWESMDRDGYESDKNRIFIYDLASNDKKEITMDWKHNVHDIQWSGDGKSINFITDVNATWQIFSIDVATGKVTQITKGDHNYRGFDIGGDFFIAERQSISSPSEIFKVTKNGEQSKITMVNDRLLNEIKLGEVKKRMVKTTDGKDMLTWVIYPPDFDPKKKYPTLLYCQGGPQASVSQFFSYRWNFQLMAANGYIVVAPNRRGLPSFGTEWNEEISGEWGGQVMKDYLSAIDDVAKEPFVDKDKLGCVGASYGGYSVYYLAGIHNKRFKSFISHCGLFNLESWYGSTEELFFANWDIGGPYWKKPAPKSYEKYSPHKFVQNWDTPILVIHGQKDYRVPVTQGMEAFTAAQLQGVESRFLYFPEEGHWVLQPQNGILWHRVFFDWLDKYLK